MLASGDTPDVARRELEHVDREVIVHAERERRRVHHLQPLLDRLQVGQLRDQLGVRVARAGRRRGRPATPCFAIRIASAPISSARRAAAVSVVKNGLPGAGGEDDDAALLEMAHRPPADVRLGDLLHVDRREHARVGAVPLERLLHGERVQHGREHPHVVAGRAVHALRRRPPCRGRCCRRRSRARARARRRAHRRAPARACRRSARRGRTPASPSGPRRRASAGRA